MQFYLAGFRMVLVTSEMWQIPEIRLCGFHMLSIFLKPKCHKYDTYEFPNCVIGRAEFHFIIVYKTFVAENS